MNFYKQPNLVYTYVEVATGEDDSFLDEMKEAGKDGGAHVTQISRPLPLVGNEADPEKSRFFMVFTGSVKDDQPGSTGKPNAAQLDILQTWGAKVYPDQESWDISKKVATDMAEGRRPQAPDDSLPAVVNMAHLD